MGEGYRTPGLEASEGVPGRGGAGGEARGEGMKRWGPEREKGALDGAGPAECWGDLGECRAWGKGSPDHSVVETRVGAPWGQGEPEGPVLGRIGRCWRGSGRW